MNLVQKRFILFLIPLFFSLPFINRAYFVDDQFFLKIATWLKDHPTRPYDFSKVDFEEEGSLTQDQLLTSIVNPLLHHYYLALLLKMGGNREWFLRLGCVLLSCFSALIIFEFAQRWTPYPFLSTVLVLLTPAYAVSAYSMLIDPTMAFLFWGSLWLFVRGIEGKNIGMAILSGGVMGLALLTKYTAILIVPLTVIWFLMNFRRIETKWPWVFSWIIPFLVLGSFLFLTRFLYGKTHLLASTAVTLQWPSLGKFFVLLVFLSGGLLVPLCHWFLIPSKKSFVAIISIGMVLYFLLTSSLGKFDSTTAFFLTTLFSSGLLFMVQCTKNCWLKRDQINIFLFSWVVLFLSMMVVVMNWVAVRYLIIVIPAVVFLAVRLIHERFPYHTIKILTRTVCLLFLCSVGIAIADYKQAETARQIVPRVAEYEKNLLETHRHFFDGQAYTMTYLPAHGWRPAPPIEELHPGDRILVSAVTMPSWWFLRRKIPVQKVNEFDFPSRYPLVVMDPAKGASWYASAWGPLPFSISGGSLEKFELFEVIDPVRNY